MGRVVSDLAAELSQVDVVDRQAAQEVATYVDEFSEQIEDLVPCIESALERKASPEGKIAILHIIEYICKTLGPKWATAFGRNITTVFCRAFEACQEDTEMQERYLFLLRSFLSVFEPAKVRAAQTRLSSVMEHWIREVQRADRPSAPFQSKLLDKNLQLLRSIHLPVARLEQKGEKPLPSEPVLLPTEPDFADNEIEAVQIAPPIRMNAHNPQPNGRVRRTYCPEEVGLPQKIPRRDET
eukprot:TRINITY_DN12946_c0_g1_i1.p1 TRINITY_DN12946_c0_g1~~TRINITY_DN12946_c0_g1_i1.p1  ORF type:complete len:248 (+),score=22.14 TRINITY_DN12946_c0_g1_i1:25-744(+)